MRHVVSASLFVLACALAQPGAAQVGDKPVPMDKAPFHIPVFLQRLPDSLERQHSARAQYGLSHPLCRLRVREPDSGLADQSGLRLVRSERAGYGGDGEPGPCDVYGCDQEWSRTHKATNVGPTPFHNVSFILKNRAPAGTQCRTVRVSRATPDHGQRAAEGLACRAETRRGDGTDHANSPGSQSLRPRRRTAEMVPGSADRGMAPYEGDFIWQDGGQTRTVKNTGTTLIEFVEFELK